MDEVSFQDWPGQPVDLNSGNNPWMPAYGLQPPSVLLEKDDFAGNPDAEYFFHPSGQFMYLETILEETSDDLRSDSGSRSSPVGWLATDSESGSVICMDQQDDGDYDSDRELACPPKRRKQDLFLTLGDENEETSLSRSSSLLQFETLEKQFQQESQSPGLYSHFSFESLDLGKKEFGSEDSSPDYDNEFFKDVTSSKQSTSRDSLLYNASTRYSGSDSSDSDTIFDTSRSCDNLKTWRSFDSLPLTNGHCVVGKRFSSENLSEDSGYGDQMLTGRTGNFSNSVGNLHDKKKTMNEKPDTNKNKDKKNSYVGFNAYDCDVMQNFNGNFGVSYQDLSIFERYDPFSEPLSKSSPLTDAYMRKKQTMHLLKSDFAICSATTKVNLDESKRSNFNSVVVHAASAPNLVHIDSVDLQDTVTNVFSVPKDLNFIGEFNHPVCSASVAAKDWNLADIVEKDHATDEERISEIGDSDHSENTCILSDPNRLEEDLSESGHGTSESVDETEDMANYKREGSYSEAMRNRVDLSDDENSLVYKKKLPKSPIVDFDRRVLKAISEQSLQSMMGSTISLRGSQTILDKPEYTASKLVDSNVAASTPNLNRLEPATRRDRSIYEEERRKSTLDIRSTARLEDERNKNILLDGSNDEADAVVMRRKGSIIKSSTSTSGMSDIDDKTLRNSVKSFTGSTSSKGVTFSPVVAEVNWGDDASVSTISPERESSYSLGSSSPEPIRSPPPQKIVKPRARYARSQSRRSASQPELSDTDCNIYKKEFIDNLNNLRHQDIEMSKSQPDMSKLKRRGSQMLKKDKDGCMVKAYVDGDGIQYKHTHLDVKTVSQSSVNNDISGSSDFKQNKSSAGGKNSLSSKFPFHFGSGPHGGHEDNRQSHVRQSSGAKQTNISSMDEGETSPRSRKSKNRTGLGGFLQRLASFRLGVKKGQEKVKRKTQSPVATSGSTGQYHNSTTNNTKPEYIYIPLKGPGSANDNNNITNVGPMSSAKPPLPKQPPPRVVHASVKKTQSQNGPGVDDRRRRRTIDSASVGVDSTTSYRSGYGNASMDGPMGLIETDLDTEVTVITSGANAKTRSLLDLGPEPRLTVSQKSDGKQGHSGRPHKSMEFLLDKQNLKVVEVSHLPNSITGPASIKYNKTRLYLAYFT
ncbi:hypothetical protein GWI33_004323 [Rhynchophorus ferrugineus]|uniref:Uncharacterized protein n=1 Tax=Rhynchophorus ferrugineus TaxID=354439 RepID=A0A834IT88_RHYFE|nr:hypothetical protein GWI33_004323 [Rhynchophorus ferrugineus]